MNRQIDEQSSSVSCLPEQINLSCDEAHLLALVRQYNNERKYSGDKILNAMSTVAHFVSPVQNKDPNPFFSSTEHNTAASEVSKQAKSPDMCHLVDSLLEEAQQEASDDE